MADDVVEILKAVVSAWMSAAESLQIAVVAPVTLRVGDQVAHAIAFLPHFGSERGILLGLAMPPHFRRDEVLVQLAETAGMRCSLLNPLLYSEYSSERFVEALKDWGFFGPAQHRRPWM